MDRRGFLKSLAALAAAVATPVAFAKIGQVDKYARALEGGHLKNRFKQKEI